RDRQLTYRELDEASNRLARQLDELGVCPGDRVALYLDKSLESVIAVYGIMKAGAAYVPFDPDAPVTRLAYIAGNCTTACVVTGVEKREQWEALLGSGAPVSTFIVLNATDIDERVGGARVVGRDVVDAQS